MVNIHLLLLCSGAVASAALSIPPAYYISGRSPHHPDQNLSVYMSRRTYGRSPLIKLSVVVHSSSLSMLPDDDKENNELLTPETYADVDIAENQVEDTIINKASEAFKSTDFEHEPHLSPELSNCELDFDELIDNTAASTKADAFQKNLLEAQLANSNKSAATKKSEAFQRSLLSARIAYDAMAVDMQQQDDWAGSETLAASMGRQVTSESLAASSVAAYAVTEAEHATVFEEIDGVAPMALGLAYQAMEQEKREAEAREKKKEEEENNNYSPITTTYQTQEILSAVDQWRSDCVDEVRSYMNQPAIERTKTRMSQRNKNVNDVDIDKMYDSTGEPSINASKEVERVQHMNNSEGVLKRELIKRGFEAKRRSLVVVAALAMVACRRLFLAYFGNVLRLI